MQSLARTCAAVGALLAANLHAGAACAQSEATDPPAAFEITANVGLVSDYRYRGLSLSDKDPAIQGGIDVTHESGLFVGTWASSIKDYGGSTMELDVYGGYRGQAAGLDYSATVLGYIYPGGHGVDYWELKGTVAKTIGPATAKLEVSWVPDQANFRGDNVYVRAGGEFAVPNTPLTLHADVGRETGGYDEKWDWEAGAGYTFGHLTASVAYIDSNYGGVNEAGRLGRGTVVASLLAEF